MKSSPKIFVVVPTYNEALVIENTIRQLVERNYDVVIVDDGSTDGTEKVIFNLPIYILRHPINLGQGAALQTGTDFAIKQGADIIVHFDADGQHQADDIPNLIEPISNGEADVVLGSRFLTSYDRQAVPFVRRLVLRGAILFNFLLTGLWLSDAHNGFRAFNSQAAQKIDLKENGFSHATEILWYIRSNKMKYLEKPTHIIYSSYSKSKGQSIWNAFDLAIDILIRRFLR